MRMYLLIFDSNIVTFPLMDNNSFIDSVLSATRL